VYLTCVDDIVDLSASIEDCKVAHINAIHFANKKKLRYSGTKCFVMVVNNINGKVEIPKLIIDDENNVLIVTEITYLGDVFNSKGNNDGLIADRVKRGIKAMVTIAALMSEVNLGIHRISTHLLLYRSLFLSILFNSQTWSNLRMQDIKALTTLQLKFLKRIIGVSSSSANSFTFLELGVLPIEHEIAKRQIMYLYRILQLDPTDPVFIMFESLKSLHEAGEKNWWTEVVTKMEKYCLSTDFEEIKSLSKDVFNTRVRKAIEAKAFSDLYEECKALKKTSDLQYQRLEVQQYLLKLSPDQARIMFKWRSKTLDIKCHRTYKYKDLKCRGCGNNDEEVDHVVNCEGISNNSESLPVEDVSCLGELNKERSLDLQEQIGRISSLCMTLETI
jgi:hypothetical protein